MFVLHGGCLKNGHALSSMDPAISSHYAEESHFRCPDRPNGRVRSWSVVTSPFPHMGRRAALDEGWRPAGWSSLFAELPESLKDQFDSELEPPFKYNYDGSKTE